MCNGHFKTMTWTLTTILPHKLRSSWLFTDERAKAQRGWLDDSSRKERLRGSDPGRHGTVHFL